MCEFIVDPLLPTREVHMIAGGSGSGKSTLACQIARELLNGGEFFGLPIMGPQKVAYLAFDRSEAGMRRTFERTLDTAEIPFPFYSVITSSQFEGYRQKTPDAILKRLLELHPDLDVIILDGVGMAFKGDSSSLAEVSSFIHNLVTLLHKHPHDITAIALHHMGKTKKGNEYENARQRLHGSVGWAATAETCILIEPEDQSNPENPNRILTLCPRNAPENRKTYCFDENGRLIPGAKLEDPALKSKETFLDLLVALNPGEYAYSMLKDLSEVFHISKATLMRWLSEAVDKNILQKGPKGKYFKAKTVIQ